MIIDILNNDFDDRRFTIDKTVKWVALLPRNQDYVLRNAVQSKSKFKAGDNIILKSVHCKYPYQFGHASGNEFQDGIRHYLQLQYLLDDGTKRSIDELSAAGIVNILSACYPTEINAFLDVPKDQDFEIIMSTVFSQISMINVPSQFADGEQYPVQYSFTIEHTLPMENFVP